jgi:hypothetical protein
MPDLNAAIRDIPRPAEVDRLQIDERGFVVPWFVDCGPAGDKPDHRVIDSRKFLRAVREQRCWVCGNKLGRVKASVIGPMCAINRITSEPASHPRCARYAVQACPFLSRPRAKRNDRNLPEERREAAGIALDRNPGVSVIWESLHASKPFRPMAGGQGILFELGAPHAVSWWKEGREATHAECVESLNSGLPALLEVAMLEGMESLDALSQATNKVMALLPALEETHHAN